MEPGWKRLIPRSLFWLLVVAGMLIDSRWGFAVFGGGLVFGLLLWQALRVSRARLEGADGAPAFGPGSGSGPGGGLVP